jgi:tetratricopeptide (TPR) repeat protein
MESSGGKTQNMEAYQLYLKGRYFQSKRIEGYPKAMEYFQQALELDPEYASAYFGIGITYYYMAGYGMIPPKEGFPKAKEAALNAIKYDENLAEAWLILAGISMDYDWNWKNLIKYSEKALKFNSGEVEINKGMCIIQIMLGDLDRSLTFGKKAAELEPVNPDGRVELAYCYLMRESYEEALRVADEMIELDPNYSEAYRVKGMVYSRLSGHDKAISLFKKSSALAEGEGFAPIYLAIELAKAGNTDHARGMLAEMLKMSSTGYVPPVFIAWLYGALNEMDEAFKWLEKAYQEKDGLVIYIKVEPAFETLKTDPRYDDFVDRFNFPH